MPQHSSSEGIPTLPDALHRANALEDEREHLTVGGPLKPHWAPCQLLQHEWRSDEFHAELAHERSIVRVGAGLDATIFPFVEERFHLSRWREGNQQPPRGAANKCPGDS